MSEARNVLVTGDLHLSGKRRDDYRFRWMERTLPHLLRKHKVRELIILGDLTEEKDQHRAELVNRIVSLFWNLSHNYRVTIIKGNHDYLNPDEPFFGFLDRLPYVSFISKPLVVPSHPALGHVVFLPHTRNHKKEWAGVDMRGADLIFAHQTFDGAHVGHGHRIDGIPLSVFPAGVHVVSGDVHIPQEQGDLVYVGAPYTVDFGDDYDPRVLVFDDDEHVYDVPCRRPQKMLVDTRFGDPDAVDLFEKFRLREGDLVKVRVTLDASRYEEWPKITKRLQTWADEEGLRVHSIVPVLKAKTNRKLQVLARKDGRSDRELVKAYSKRHGVSQSTVKTGLRMIGDS